MTVKDSNEQAPNSPRPTASDSQFTGENLAFIEDLYRQYLEDASSVDPSWKPIFQEYFGGDAPVNSGAPHFKPRSIFEPARVPTRDLGGEAVWVDKAEGITVKAPGRTEGFAARVEAIVRAFRLHGHLIAKIDPLDRPRRPAPPELEPSLYGFTSGDLKAKVNYEPLFGSREVTLGDLLQRLRDLYCGHIAVEYQNMPGSQSRTWLRDRIERNDYAPLDVAADGPHILKKLVDADAFETFLHKKYVGAKRFSLTGGESLIPMLDFMLEEAADSGVEEVVVGMAHRGRLNVLHNIMNKPAEAMFSEFEKVQTPEEYVGSSDVKYHMGFSSDHPTRNGKTVHLSLCFNPSHLEFVNPVVLGRVRAKQDRLGTEAARQKLLPLLLHGDAAFSGQGIVTESLNLARVKGYNVGGTIHVVINNQIGFTTNPEDGRSTTYATDVAKMLEVPIFHVNGDDPEACVRVMKLAMQYRQRFGEDVIVDLVCYRRYGHNEGDEPRFTQPEMYGAIDSSKPVREKYVDSLIERQIMSADQTEAVWNERMDYYGEVFKEVREQPQRKSISSLDGLWTPYHGGELEAGAGNDAPINEDLFKELARKLTEVPESHNVHRTLRRFLKGREQVASGEAPADWGTGEALAFASLLINGTRIRMTGQDCIRGTFSHRHAALFDTETGEGYWPLRNLKEDQASIEIYNSTLSENAVLGFEYGFSLDSPDALVLWEAQFGDFVNGAQVIIDQFINSGEDKWKRLSALTLLLPHGYEGQGPEHSSARLERFLQLCAGDNMYVCNMTTPAQYFHALRRQVLHSARKPLIVMSPKSLLRHKDAVSPMEDFTTVGFQPILKETRESVNTEKVRRVLLCSGKVYYDLCDYAAEQGIDDVAIVRVEQLYPLEGKLLQDAVAPFKNSREIVWVQEEPKNMGSWHYIFPRLIELFGADPLPAYVGRVASASPATGAYESHELEQRALVTKAFAETLD
ncbi:2-oxoglutarate dehydrogenase E1 component [Lujinxingia vulgaris]|uniref:oxoglutarate dehydrogenase (succinyl-transferring) n=1 Tax=Lujinxingia vulgaris TaxID=2600176 RepID=A0A5C6XD17_9DELT|nr:2-oxoglutarate dehydrogenase E1 component [Lujinxingia vulgaris]TXD34982.1 2-oxoglutarate dehydrogenase E1 component [Lujinxingia vulgaris]